MSGISDHWERIWSPYRKEYNERLAGGDMECPFCHIPVLSDEESLILARGEFTYVVLNRYPYNPGHLLVCTYRHMGEYLDLTAGELNEISSFTKDAIKALRGISSSVNFNIGINLGRVAGAGIPEHFHQHIVPRWQGDSNFMPVIGGTKVLSQMLDETRDTLANLWPK